MPKMSGIEALKKIKKMTTAFIIALTANVFKEDVEKYFQLGFDDYVSKPIKLETLQKIFDKYLQKKDLISSLQKDLNLSEDVIRSLTDVYFENIFKDLQKLKIAIKKEDFENMSKIAHKIKGSSLNLKLDKIAKIAYEIEINAKNKKEIDYNGYFEEMKNEIEKVKKKIENENNII